MLPAREHPDTAEEPFTGALARLALVFAATTIIVPAIVAVLR